MGQITTIGLDIAKSVFQVHGVDAEGMTVLRRRLTRTRLLAFFSKLHPCRVGIEACASSHHWARELRGLGHDVRLMPPSYVKPYVKRQKNDAADAEAICEAVMRPTMRFVEVKTAEQQSTLVLHRTRAILMRQRIQLSNAIRGHMAEFGIVAPIGRNGLERLLEIIRDEAEQRVPAAARTCLQMLADQLQLVNSQALETERRIRASARASDGGGPAANGDPRRRAFAGERPRCHHSRSASLPFGPEPGRLDRTGAATTLKRRQGTPRRDYQAR